MIDLTPELLVIIMAGGALIGVMSGYPLGLVIGGISLVIGYTIFGPRIVDIIYMQFYGAITSYVLLAAPLFIFMGAMLERSGVAEKLYNVLYEWLGGFRGGLAIVTVFMGTVLAMAVGIIAASVTMMARVALPSMLKWGYSKSLATGAVTAGGVLGILIPPSIMLVLYGPMADISVGRLFFGAVVPGLVLSALYMVYIAIRSSIQPHIAPVAPAVEVQRSFVKKTWTLIVATAPIAILMMSVLGVIFFGIATPTEAAGIGALMATLITIGYGKFSFQVLKETALTTMRMCGFIFLIVSPALAFSAVFLAGGGRGVVEDIILGAGGGRWGAFAIIMLILFLMGKLIEWVGIIFIMVPIITPIGAALGFDPLWFAMMVCVNLQMAFMTPPVASGVFICYGACDPELGVTTGDIIRGVLPHVAIIGVTLLLLAIFPQLITWLPEQMIR